jgi:hypothetical protein
MMKGETTNIVKASVSIIITDMKQKVNVYGLFHFGYKVS